MVAEDRCSDPDSPAMQALRVELVSPGIVPVSVPMLLEVDETLLGVGVLGCLGVS